MSDGPKKNLKKEKPPKKVFCLKAPLASTPVTLGLVLAASVNAAIPIMAEQQLNSL